MNTTIDNVKIPATCKICEISSGFNSTDRTSIIVMVVLTGVALVLCYAGVLWYAIRTRFLLNDQALIIPENVHKNSAFDKDETQFEYTQENLTSVNNAAAIQPALFVIENEKERF